MSREIKFRCWDVRKGYYRVGMDNICIGLGGHLMWQFGYDAPAPLDPDELQHYILEQFTGLKDKAGKDIYEGDILKVQGCYRDAFVVEYIGLAFQLFDGKDGIMGAPVFDSEEWELSEVIGNIHETPELVNGNN